MNSVTLYLIQIIIITFIAGGIVGGFIASAVWKKFHRTTMNELMKTHHIAMLQAEENITRLNKKWSEVNSITKGRTHGPLQSDLSEEPSA